MKAIQTANKGGNSRFSLKNNNYIKLLSNINRTGLFSAFTFILLALTCLFPISKGEQSTEAVTGTAQSSSLTLSVSSAAASVEFDVNSTDGTFASSTADNSAAFSVVTNNFSGYTLSISGSDNEGKLYDITKQNALSSLTVATTEATFSSSTDLNGKWGYKPSKFNSLDNDNYFPAPTTEASTLDKTAAANTTANDYSISLGLRADYTTTADTYFNSFIITAVPNPIAYVITYDANTTDTVSNMPAAQNSTTSATSITLSDKTPAREGYDFKGWCTTAPTTTNPDACTGTTYQPRDTYGIDQTVENITTLYAIWEEQIAGYIQDYTYARCSNEAASKAVKLMDKRDDKVYTARYINGLCTMTQNLDFELTTGMTLSPDTTNVTSSRTLSTVGSLTAGDSYDEPRIATSETADYGTYYNYAAATVGTITGSSNTTEAAEDICPKGWRLPTNTEQRALNNNTNVWNPNYPTEFTPVAARSYGGGALNNSGSPYGYWWSSTVGNDISRRALSYIPDYGLSSGSGYDRRNGFSVRCVKAKPGVTISFNANGGTGVMDMQKIDAGQSANLTANTFTRTDYVFTGWNTKADGTGTAYADTATYTAPASEDNKIVVLYAQWKRVYTITFVAGTGGTVNRSTQSVPEGAEISVNGNTVRTYGVTTTGNPNSNYAFTGWTNNCGTSMPANDCAITASWRTNSNTLQKYTASGCSSGAYSAAKTLTDARDGKTYTVRYINGICTMTQNLDFGLVTGIELSSTSTNTKSTKTIDAVGVLSSGNTFTEARIATSSTSGYGTYYNYCAATAGEICQSSNLTNATEDVCPAGWRLPTGGQGEEHFILNNNTWQRWNANYPTAFSPVAAGRYDKGSFINSGSNGYWWSSTVDDVTAAHRYGLRYNTSLGLNSDSGDYRSYGYSVRCVLK